MVVPDNFRNTNSYQIKKIPTNSSSSSVVYHAVFICSRSLSLNSQELIGSAKLQLRQLAKMGYRVHTVIHNLTYFRRRPITSTAECDLQYSLSFSVPDSAVQCFQLGCNQ
jgi:hypothetical protein